MVQSCVYYNSRSVSALETLGGDHQAGMGMAGVLWRLRFDGEMPDLGPSGQWVTACIDRVGTLGGKRGRDFVGWGGANRAAYRELPCLTRPPVRQRVKRGADLQVYGTQTIPLNGHDSTRKGYLTRPMQGVGRCSVRPRPWLVSPRLDG